jgi:hypothetical protein
MAAASGGSVCATGTSGVGSGKGAKAGSGSTDAGDGGNATGARVTTEDNTPSVVARAGRLGRGSGLGDGVGLIGRRGKATGDGAGGVAGGAIRMLRVENTRVDNVSEVCRPCAMPRTTKPWTNTTATASSQAMRAGTCGICGS